MKARCTAIRLVAGLGAAPATNNAPQVYGVEDSYQVEFHPVLDDAGPWANVPASFTLALKTASGWEAGRVYVFDPTPVG